MSGEAGLDRLRTGGWLSQTPPSFRDAVLSRCVLRRFERNETLYRAGDEPGGLFGLVEGGFGVIVAPGERAPFLGVLARPGFWIGEASVITRGPRAIGITATRDSVAAHLPLKQWDAIVLAEAEAWRWLALLSLRNSLLALAVIDALRRRRAEHRLAALLAILHAGSEAQGSGHAHDAPSAPIEISQDELAAMANLSRSSAGRLLDTLETHKVISRSYRTLRVLDLDALLQYCGD